MRIINIVLKFLLLLTILLAGGYLIVREGSLWWAQYKIRQDIALLTRSNTWGEAANSCFSQTGTEAVQLQLRFLNSQEYRLEVGCESPKYIAWGDTKKLFWKVRKTGGWPGFVAPIDTRQAQGELTLSLWGRNTTLVADNNNRLDTKSGLSTALTTSLISTCQTHGLVCCDKIFEQGQGDLFSQAVNDCQDSCYSSCVRRPNLLFFQADPAVDPNTRQVVLSKANAFTLFNYTFEENDNPIKSITIDFGDGEQQELPSPSGKVNKQFECLSEADCSFTVNIWAVDDRGIRSADLRTNTIEVIVR